MNGYFVDQRIGANRVFGADGSVDSGDVGLATESDTAFALVAVQKMLVGIASEVDTAFALSPAAAPGDDLDLILKILVNRQELNPATGTFTLYDDDATTVLYTTNAWADAAGTVPYSGGALRRIDALF